MHYLPNKYDKLYIQTAINVAELSYCKRNKVGAVIVNGGTIISMGYNGTPSNFHINTCEDALGDTLPFVIHAEANCIAKAAKTGITIDGASMYVTLSPCFNCALLIIQSGIKKLFYKEEYRNVQPLELLRMCNVETIQLNGDV